MAPDWFLTTKRFYLLDFQMPDSADQMPIGQPPNLRDLDVERIVRQLHEAGVQALYTHAKDNQGNCYYNTQVGHKHTGIGDRDLMAEFSKHCRAAGMKILYYVQLTRERRANAEELYAARRHDGTPVVLSDQTPQLPSRQERPVACLNGPHREYILAIVRELTANYDFDGYWLDCFGWWGRTNPCYCDACKAKYREDLGSDLPRPDDKESAAWKRYLRWRQRLNTVILHEVIGAIKDLNPRLAVTHNGSGFPIWADWAFCDRDDFVSHEFHYNEGHGNLALSCRKQRALKPGVPFEIEIWRFFNRQHDTLRGYQVRPLPMHEVEMATVLAHGGFVQYYDQINPDGTLDRRSIAVCNDAFDFVRQREEWLTPGLGRGARPVPYAGLVWSKATEAHAQPAHARLHTTALEGAHHALMESHLSFALLGDHHVARDEFHGCRVVVLPSVTCLSDIEASALNRFVEEGGGLVATYRTSLCDEYGQARANFALASLLGANYLEPATYLYSFVQPEVAHPVNDGLELHWPRTLWKTLQVKVAARAGTEAVAQMVNPMRGFHMGHPPAELTPHPSILVRQHGKGRVVYFAAPVDYVYCEYGHPDYKRWLVNAVRWAAGLPPPVEVEAPATVEAVAWECDGELRVHLVNRTAAGPARSRSAVFQEHFPVLDVTVRLGADLGRQFTTATLQPEGRRLDFTRDGETATIFVPRLDTYSIVVVR
jgi:hypothetical protein